MSRWRSSVCSGTAIACVLAVAAAAQVPPQRGEALHSRRVLHRAASELLRGERGQAQQQVARWTVADLQTRIADTRPGRDLLDRWNPFGSTDPSYVRWTARVLAAAATVHLLAAIDSNVPITDRQRDLHADAAEALSAALDEIAFDPEVRTRIYLVLIQRHQRRLMPRPVVELLDRLPGDLRERAPILRARGWVAELRASPRNEDGPAVSSRVESLEEAVDLYGRAALTSNADSDDARLRQGRALQLLGKGELAQSLFRAVLSGSTQPDTRYLAALFLGLLSADENRPGEALRHFEEALTLRPAARSVRVAWSHAAFRADDRLAARAHVLATADGLKAFACAEDPWCLYDFGDAARPAEAIEKLLRALGS